VITFALYPNTFVKKSNYDYEETTFMVDPLAEARKKAAERAVLVAAWVSQKRNSIYAL